MVEAKGKKLLATRFARGKAGWPVVGGAVGKESGHGVLIKLEWFGLIAVSLKTMSEADNYPVGYLLLLFIIFHV